MSEPTPPPTKKFDSSIYARSKELVMKMEEVNDSCLYLFGGGDDWWKMGGNSLLIYKYTICPSIRVKPKTRPDDDYLKVKFEDGIIAFNGLDSIKKRLEKAGVFKSLSTKGGIARFYLKRAVPAAQIEEFKKEYKYELDKIYSIIKPKITIYPELHTLFREIVKRMYNSGHQMNDYDRRCLGDEMVHFAVDMENTYLAINREVVKPADGWDGIMNDIEKMQICLVTATELNIIDHNTAAFMGANLIDAKKTIKGILSEDGSS